MDTFMDKLAQKLTAQEMIKANSAAEAAELSRLREQKAEYESLLQLIKRGSQKNIENAEKVEQSAKRAEDLIAAGISKIEEIQASSQNTEELNTLLGELKQIQTTQLEQITDYVHKENVKVYRNVQAVVVEEAAKQMETTGKHILSVSGRVGALLGISIISLLLSAAGVIIQVLVQLHII